jgi:putative transposase
MATPARRREAALKALRGHKGSQRRACNLVGVDPKTVRRGRSSDHVEIRRKMHGIADNHRRFGYRRVGILLEWEELIMNPKKLYCLYREEGLPVRRWRGRKRARGTRTPMPVPVRPNVRWALDFVSALLAHPASSKFWQ